MTIAAANLGFCNRLGLTEKQSAESHTGL